MDMTSFIRLDGDGQIAAAKYAITRMGMMGYLLQGKLSVETITIESTGQQTIGILISPNLESNILVMLGAVMGEYYSYVQYSYN